MKIGVLGIEGYKGKEDIVDSRVDTLQEMFKSAKKVYIQADIVNTEDRLIEADAILCDESARLDLVVADLEFIETRLERVEHPAERALLEKCKQQLDREGLLNQLALTPEEETLSAGSSLLTRKPVHVATPEALQDKRKLLFDAYYAAGYISFFTAGDKDAHAWPIKRGSTAYEAAGAIHSQIQKGFIRAEVVSYGDLVKGGLSQARQENKLRLEMKDYIVQDGDWLVIRTNK